MGERRKVIPSHPAAPSSLRNLLPWGLRAPGRSSGQGPRSPSFCGGQGSGGPGWGEAGGETLSQRSDPWGEKLVQQPFPLRASQLHGSGSQAVWTKSHSEVQSELQRGLHPSSLSITPHPAQRQRRRF